MRKAPATAAATMAIAMPKQKLTLSSEPSLAEAAYVTIRERIVSLEIPPGAPLREENLMADLGMGRTPVREAIKRLVDRDLVVIYPHRGTFASEVKIADLSLIFDVREVLEGHAAYRAAQRRTPADLAELEELRSRLIDGHAQADIHKMMAIDADVHRFIYRCARNAYMESALDNYLNLALRLCYLALDGLPGLSDEIADHDALLASIKNTSGDKAGQLMRTHIRNCARSIRETI